MMNITTKTLNSKPSGIKPSRKSSAIWKTVECGAKSSTQSSPRSDDASSPNGCSRSSEMACFVPIWLPVVTAKFPVLISL